MTALHTPREHFIRGMSNGSKATSYAEPVAQTAEPVTLDAIRAVFKTGHNHTKLIFFGDGAEESVAQAKVWLWYKMASPNRLVGDNVGAVADVAGPDVNVLWVPQLVGVYDIDLGATTGVAGAAVAADELFVDTIIASGTPDATAEAAVYSPVSNLIGYLLLDTLGAQKVEVQFDIDVTGTNMANANCAAQML